MQDIITIDGPAGAGKSTIAKETAKALGWIYLDTGAIYRALAVTADKKSLNPSEQKAAEHLAATVKIEVRPSATDTIIIADGQDVTGLLRQNHISQIASTISAWPGVRAALLNLQREIGAKGRVVAEGRDMGTVVFPAARWKFFLSASPAARAKRRYLELIEREQKADEKIILAEIEARDQADESRQEAPLKAAAGAVIIDSTSFSISEVLNLILKEVRI